MSDSQKPDVRFSIRSLLIFTAAVAGAVAFVVNVFPSYIAWFTKADSGELTMFAIVATIALVPLAYFLAVRLTMRGLSLRPRRPRDDRPLDDETSA
jgi:hypothetical protein